MTATSAATLPVSSPYTGELVGEAPRADRARTLAMLDAGAAYRDELSRHDRSEILFAVADALAARRDELSALITAESGLCLKDTRHEVGRAVDVFRFAAIEALHDDGETFAGDISPHGRDRRAHTLRVPVRLVAAITPFNHPLNQVAHKLAPAIALGAPIVVKPSEKTPLSALALIELIREAGLPDAAAQVVCGDPAEILDAFLGHDAVEVVSFTGGVAVGKSIAARLGYRRAVLELGGNDPLIVLADADLDEAAELAVRGAFQNSGQRCTAVKRIIAVDAIADALAARIAAGAAALRVGDPAAEDTDVGTVIDEAAARLIEERVHAAVADGATLLYGGDRAGALLVPAVLDRVPDRERACRRGDLRPGGAAHPSARPRSRRSPSPTRPHTRSRARSAPSTGAPSRAAVRELRAGTVNVREVPGWRTELTPFGGTGDSGLGVKEGVREAMRAMSFTKLYTLPWS